MDKSFWNERYQKEAFAYGEAPNDYFKKQLDALPPGTILLTAEGEGRNAVYAASSGWQVSAFDLSEAGKQKAEQLASKHQVHLEYQVGEWSRIHYPEATFDAVAIIFNHFPESERPAFHQQVRSWLKPGGWILMEVFAKSHLPFREKNPKVGGPGDQALLYSGEEITRDFSGFQVVELTETEVELNEGLYHQGLGSVIRFLGKKH